MLRGERFTLVPVLVGELCAESQQEYGKLFAPFLDDPANLFVLSSDFCHWGQRRAVPALSPGRRPAFPSRACRCALLNPPPSPPPNTTHHHSGRSQSAGRVARLGGAISAAQARLKVGLPARRFNYISYDKSKGSINDSIEALDRAGMEIIESQSAERFHAYLAEYKNTICGRYPIALLLSVRPPLRTDGGPRAPRRARE